jgi:hypothetical protein
MRTKIPECPGGFHIYEDSPGTGYADRGPGGECKPARFVITRPHPSNPGASEPVAEAPIGRRDAPLLLAELLRTYNLRDDHGNTLQVGDYIRNVESGWRGQIQTTVDELHDLMLICYGVNWWSGDLDRDDEQWHAPADVVRCDRVGAEPPNPINMM